jgi:hypothetical protein
VNDAASDVGHLVFVETRQTNGVQVVDEGSADLGLARVQPVGADANHFDISRAFWGQRRTSSTAAWESCSKTTVAYDAQTEQRVNSAAGNETTLADKSTCR